MATSVRERQDRLLADPQTSAAHLDQALGRAELLLRVARTVSATQNPLRAMEALVTHLLEDLVDVAEVVVRSGPTQYVAAAVRGHEPHATTGRWADGSPGAFDELIRRAVREDVVLPAVGPAHRRALGSLLEPPVVAEAEAVRAEELVALPLRARGRCFGLLVLGRTPGLGFSGARDFLDDLAERVAAGLDATFVLAESRRVAGVLRRSLAPAEMPRVPGLGIASFYRVAHQSEEAGGDFIDVHGPDDDLVLLCGDVTGKGVEAAVQAKRIRNAVRTSSLVQRSPGWILGLVNRVLVAEADPFAESLATAVCARLRVGPDALVVDLANAGHPPALLLRADGTLEESGAGGPALCLLDDAAFEEARHELGPGDTLLVHTDGVTEARGRDDLFGDRRLRDHVRTLAGLPAAAVVESVAVAVSDHLADRPHDDIAVVAVQFRPEPA